MCTPAGTAASAKGIGSIGDGHAEHCEGQVRRFGGSLPFFFCFLLLAMHPAGRMNTSALLTGDICNGVIC